MTLAGATLPDYQGNNLAQVIPAVAAQLGLNYHDPFGLPAARGYLILMVDGLGWHQLQTYAETAEYLSSAPAKMITCGVPSTTAVSLSSLGTGLPPGSHGLVGYRFLNPLNGTVMNALSWENGPDDVVSFQPHPTFYSLLDGDAAVIALARFQNSGLTQAAMRGADFYPVMDEKDYDARIDQARKATATHRLTYCYERLLDHTGHTHGVGSWQWLDQLAAVDDLATGLRSALPDDICILVTGDHGMINVSPERFLVIEDEPNLGGYQLLAGEARFRHIYTPRPAELFQRYEDTLGERAWVFTREEGIELGLFGEVAPSVRPRLGDVMVAMRDNWVLMTNTHPVEKRLRGVHGSLTAAEMQVPLITLARK